MEKILSVNMGMRHSDWELVAEQMRAHGVEYVPISITETDPTRINYDEISLIELRSCRGWQTKWNDFKPWLMELKTSVTQYKQTTGRTIPIVNDVDVFSTFLSKAYLIDLQRNGVEIVPTTIVKPNDDVDIHYLVKSYDRFVLKPTRGSKARGLVFGQKLGNGKYKLTFPTLNEAPTFKILNKVDFTTYFDTYRKESYENTGNGIAVQQFVEGLETSAVWLGGRFHFIDRTVAEGKLVAHEEFGGQNILNVQPDRQLSRVASHTLGVIKNNLGVDPAYLRIDMLFDGSPNSRPKILEIEAGSARLFLDKADRAYDYANLLIQRMDQNQYSIASNVRQQSHLKIAA